MPRGRMRTLEKLPEPNATPPLGPLAARRRAGVQWQIANRGFDPNRIDVAAAARDDRAVAVAQPVQPRAPDAPARDALPRRRALDRASSTRPSAAGRTRSACCPGETVTRPAVVRRRTTGRYVFHCHSLEHGDKAMMLQLEVTNEARGCAASALGLRCGRARRAGRRPTETCHGARRSRPGTSPTSTSRRATPSRGRSPAPRRPTTSAAERPNWTDRTWARLASPPASGTARVVHVRRTAGDYAFICQVHPDTMAGRCTVHGAGPAPRPPPVPLSQQAFANDTPADPPVETAVALRHGEAGALRRCPRSGPRAARSCASRSPRSR